MGTQHSVPTLPGPSPPELLQRFLETQDLSELEKPITFSTDRRVNGYNQCINCIVGWSSLGVTCVTNPIGVFCPGVLLPYFGLKLDNNSIQVHSATNDFCCHIAKTVKTLPLEKVQDVELTQNCLHTCFGVQQINVQTAGTSEGAELSAAFLADPGRVREALQLAVRLTRQNATAAPAAGAMAMSRRAGGGLAARLSELDALVKRGALSAEEAGAARIGALASPADLLPRLAEAADLRDEGAIAPEEFAALKAAFLAQMAAGARTAGQLE